MLLKIYKRYWVTLTLFSLYVFITATGLYLYFYEIQKERRSFAFAPPAGQLIYRPVNFPGFWMVDYFVYDYYSYISEKPPCRDFCFIPKELADDTFINYIFPVGFSSTVYFILFLLFDYRRTNLEEGKPDPLIKLIDKINVINNENGK